MKHFPIEILYKIIFGTECEKIYNEDYYMYRLCNIKGIGRASVRKLVDFSEVHIMYQKQILIY